MKKRKKYYSQNKKPKPVHGFKASDAHPSSGLPRLQLSSPGSPTPLLLGKALRRRLWPGRGREGGSGDGWRGQIEVRRASAGMRKRTLICFGEPSQTRIFKNGNKQVTEGTAMRKYTEPP